MQLFNLNREDYFIIDGDHLKTVYRLETIDGMYSRCFDDKGNLHHFSVGTPVIQVNKEYELSKKQQQVDDNYDGKPRSYR